MSGKKTSEESYLEEIRKEAELRHKKIAESQEGIKTDSEPATEPVPVETGLRPVSESEQRPPSTQVEDSTEPEISISIKLSESDFITDYDLHLFHAGTF